MKFYLQLRKNLKPFHTLEYEIFEDELSQKWANVFQHVSGGKPVDVPSLFPQNILIPGSMEKMYRLWDEMVINVHAANGCGGYFDAHPIEITPDIYFETIDSKTLQDELNYLHQCFHEYDELLRWKPELNLTEDAAPFLYNLNSLIHRVENCHRTMNQRSKSIILLARPCHEDMAEYRPPIDDKSLYRFFDQPWQNGDLTLGYATTGKNLWHACLDNDIQLVKDGMIRPQVDITTEIRCYFCDEPMKESVFTHSRERMQNWVKQNDLTSYIDPLAPEHNITSEPRIGHLAHELSFSEALELITDEVDIGLAWLES